MSKYGLVAVVAVRRIQELGEDPLSAWQRAAAEIITESKSSRDKGCPRGAFLGLCEEGLVKGVLAGNYTKSRWNKKYALRTYSIINRDISLAGDVNSLWDEVVSDRPIGHNGQADVVVELYNNDLLTMPKE